MRDNWYPWHVETADGVADEGRAQKESNGWLYAERIATAVLSRNPRVEVHLYVGVDVITVKPGRLWDTDGANLAETLAVLRATCAARIAACY